MTDDEAFVKTLRDWCDAYPEDIFPVPPPERQAKDGVAAHVMRRMALPVFAEAADRIEALSVDLVAERALADQLAAGLQARWAWSLRTIDGDKLGQDAMDAYRARRSSPPKETP